jgi:hypothetical protein
MVFRENGEAENGEMVMLLPLTKCPRLGVITADNEDAIPEFIENEKENGNKDADLFPESEVCRAINEERLLRFTLWGKTIAIALDGSILLNNNHSDCLAKIAELIKK